MLNRSLAIMVLLGACSSDGAGPPPEQPAPVLVPAGESTDTAKSGGPTAVVRVPQGRVAPDSVGPGVEATDAIAFNTPVTANGPSAWAFVGQQGARLRLTADDAAAVEVWGPRRNKSSWAGAVRVTPTDGVVTLPEGGAYLLVWRGAGGSRSLTLECISAECRAECGPRDECPVGAWCHRVVCVRAPCPSFCDPQERRPRG